MSVPWEVAGGITAACAGLLGLWSVVRLAAKGVRFIDRLALLLFGDEAAKIPSLADRLDSIDQRQQDSEEWQEAAIHRLVTVEARTTELSPNGGSTVKDRVGQVVTQLAVLRQDVNDQHDQLVRHEALSDATWFDTRRRVTDLAQQVAAIAAPTPRSPDAH